MYIHADQVLIYGELVLLSPENIYFVELTHYRTMPHFDALKICSSGKHCDKRRNCMQQAISPFLTMFSTLYVTDFSF